MVVTADRHGDTACRLRFDAAARGSMCRDGPPSPRRISRSGNPCDTPQSDCCSLVEWRAHLIGSLGSAAGIVVEHLAVGDHLVDDPVFHSSVDIHDEVTLRVAADTLKVLASVVGNDPLDPPT